MQSGVLPATESRSLRRLGCPFALSPSLSQREKEFSSPPHVAVERCKMGPLALRPGVTAGLLLSEYSNVMPAGTCFRSQEGATSRARALPAAVETGF